MRKRPGSDKPIDFAPAAVRVLVLALFLCGILAGFAHAGELEEKIEELERIQRQMDQYRQGITRARTQEKSVLGELKTLEKNISRTENDLRYVEARLRSTEQGIRETEKEIARAETDIQRRTGILKDRLRAIYKAGPLSYLEVLLGAAGFQDFLSRLEMIQAIVRFDVDLIDSLEAEKASCEEKKAELEVKKEQLAALKEEVATRKRELTARAAEREQYLARVTRQRAEYEKALDELEELSERLTKVIQELQAKQSIGPRGPLSMIMPAKGKVTSRFGMRMHPIVRKVRMHTGIDIGAPWGASVLAAESGVVLHSGVLGGYGYAIIIDHGGGVSTLYGHCSSLLVKEGERVAKGQLIAKVGSTGLSTGPHLHFEVRVNGSPKDPLQWVH